MRLRLVGLSFAGLAATLSAAEPGLRIVTRETFPAGVIETVDYILPDRSRTDWHMTAGHGMSRIVRCDLQRDILLNQSDRTFMTNSQRAHSIWLHPLFQSFGTRKLPRAKEPTLLIETTTVRTGEKKMAFGYPARRVITTERHKPLGAAGGAQRETEIDGWYIDLETRSSCERSQISGRIIATGYVLTSGSSNTSDAAQIPALTFKDVGEPERGYPIETSTSSRFGPGAADEKETTFVTRKVVTELSSGPLDPALFEIPSGFRPQSRLAEFGTLWGEAWYTVRDLVASMFH